MFHLYMSHTQDIWIEFPKMMVWNSYFSQTWLWCEIAARSSLPQQGDGMQQRLDKWKVKVLVRTASKSNTTCGWWFVHVGKMWWWVMELYILYNLTVSFLLPKKERYSLYLRTLPRDLWIPNFDHVFWGFAVRYDHIYSKMCQVWIDSRPFFCPKKSLWIFSMSLPFFVKRVLLLFWDVPWSLVFSTEIPSFISFSGQRPTYQRLVCLYLKSRGTSFHVF